MTPFADTDHLYTCFRALFDRLQEKTPHAADAVLKSRLVIRLHCSEPAAEIIINGQQRPAQVSYGPSRLRPTLDVELAAGTLHRILMGELSLKKSLAGGLLKVRGPAWKTLALADIFRHGQALYPDVYQASCAPAGRGLAKD